MKKQGADWFLVPHCDEHQNEYLPERAERLAWLTGFTGSAGFALVGLKQAYLFVDGRYTVQAQSQTDNSCFTLKDLVNEAPSTFAKSVVRPGDTIVHDPWLMTISQNRTWEKLAEKYSSEWLASSNLVDQIWHDQPAPPAGRAWLHPVAFAGRTVKEKLADIRKVLKTDGADHLLVSDPASLAWTFNIRGNDLIHNPLVLGWAIIPARNSKPVVFVDEGKFSNDDVKALKQVTKLAKPETFVAHLTQLSKDSKIHCDPNLVASFLGKLVEDNSGKLITRRDPVIPLRAIKNEVELEGARNAHIRDGVAMTRFLAWLDNQPHGSVSEIDAAQKLESLRAETALQMGSRLEELSFDTISGAGANGAIVHYRVTEKTNATLKADSLYLVDSGGQYQDGTTDITRTIAIGTPPHQAITDNTLVMKGHIAIARARFPKGTRGVDLDVLARIALWQGGKDYAHGTGHGIGSFLNVHEGPQSLSRRGMEEFRTGMILSNEPGYYREGQYGIRIENLVIVTEEQEIVGGDKPMMGFETLTLCPFDLSLIDKTLLTAEECAWLNDYHKQVRLTLSPYLNKRDQAWLKKATRAL